MSRVSAKAYHVYVLWSARARRFYIGLSENPQSRLAQHNHSGRGWTARYAPWELVYSECCENYSLAKQRESQLKAQKHGGGFWTLTGLDPARFSPSSLGS
jgi:putative endonuclease